MPLCLANHGNICVGTLTLLTLYEPTTHLDTKPNSKSRNTAQIDICEPCHYESPLSVVVGDRKVVKPSAQY